MSQKVSYRLLSLLAVFAILLTGCGGGDSNKLIGKWEYKEPTTGMTVSMEFTKDKINISAAGMTAQEATYTYVDSDSIKVKDPDSGTEEEIAYSIKGDVLTFDFGGESVDFTKVK